jgi:uncharacterized protein
MPSRSVQRWGWAPWRRHRDVVDPAVSHAENGMPLAERGVPLRQRADIAVFLVFTFALTAAVWTPVIRAGSLSAGGGIYVALGMWCPAVAAIATRLLFRRGLRGFGWRRGHSRYLLLGYALPALIAAVVYGAVWVTGLGRFAPADMAVRLSADLGLEGDLRVGLVPIWFVITGTLVVLVAVLTALGEELGWRGFLVPELARSTSFHRVALISGAVWAAWHSPVLLFADYNAGTPPWYGLACFSMMVIGSSVVYAWLRLRSGSVWPAVLLHASHNAFIQQFFDPVTASSGVTAYVTTEFGIGLAIAWAVVAVWFWRRQPSPPRMAGQDYPAGCRAQRPRWGTLIAPSARGVLP